MIWDVDLRQALVHDHSRFELDVRFVSDASRLVLYGPSGAGKTQTLKLIVGIARPDDGRVAVAGRAMYDSASRLFLSPQERRLGYVFQDYALFPHLTVRQNIAFGLRRGLLNPSRSFAAAAVERWVEAFHLESVMGHYPHQLSGGQRQRTALARALVNEPAALLLDEPFAALDKRLRQHLRDELKELQEQLRVPLLLITHDDEDLRVLAQEVVHLHAGRVAAAPPALEAAIAE
ncbi:MAG TPA: ATP-binding cassette domain-containing protein [Burkholderiaceae bacterium]|nr:ATP-binding cassette domain-containing protein [Burkholderiaceae bacterium]